MRATREDTVHDRVLELFGIRRLVDNPDQRLGGNRRSRHASVDLNALAKRRARNKVARRSRRINRLRAR